MVFAETSHCKVPLAAPALIAVLGSSLQRASFGWAVGVAVRAVPGVWLALAVGALNLQRRNTDWTAAITRGRAVVPAPIVFYHARRAAGPSVAILPKLFQGALAPAIGILVLVRAVASAKRRGTSFRKIAARIPQNRRTHSHLQSHPARPRGGDRADLACITHTPTA